MAALGLPCAFSEYRMEAQAEGLILPTTNQITLEAVNVADAEALVD